MAIITLKVKGLRCDRCKHEWLPRNGVQAEELPKQCPACHSPYWNAGPVQRKTVSRAAKVRKP